ncbi:MAG TPA: hypothetical protein VIW47_03855 [Nitrospiraceae bacterium]|jgi:hypothetical protein
MLDNTPAELDDREWARRKMLLHAILRYLTERGPTYWATLYLHFDPDGTGEIGPALRHLATFKLIAVDRTIVKVTSSGMEQLKSWK